MVPMKRCKVDSICSHEAMGADVGAAAAVDLEVEQGILVAEKLDGVDGDGAGRELGGLAFAGESVGGAAGDFQCAVDGGLLLDGADEALQGGFDLLA